MTDLSWAQQRLETQQLAIRNGSLTATNVQLTLEEEKAIGWLSISGSRCTATVISKNILLTAKHCFFREDGSLVRSQFTFNILDDEGRLAQRSEGRLNAEDAFNVDYTFPFEISNVEFGADNDLAIIRFPGQPFDISGLKPIPINLTPIDGDFKANLTQSMVDISGYGSTRHVNEAGRYFASVRVELVNPLYIITNGLNEQGVCEGDSGGPMLAPGIDGELSIIAVVTGGDQCCIALDQHTRVDVERNGLFRNLNVYTSNSARDTLACRGLSKDYSCQFIGDDELLTFCLNGEVQQVNCRDRGLFCAFDINDSRFDCISTTEFACPSVPNRGTCDGNTLLRCEYGVLRKTECVNATCKVFDDGQRVACVSTSFSDQIQCEEDVDALIDIAQEVKFTSTSGCMSSSRPHLFSFCWLFFFALLPVMGRNERRLKSSNLHYKSLI